MFKASTRVLSGIPAIRNKFCARRARRYTWNPGGHIPACCCRYATGHSSPSGTIQRPAKLQGDPVPAADDVSVNIYNARPAFWASDAGLLASLSGSPPTKSLVWLSRDGTATQVAPEDAYWNLKLSRDASRMAVSRWEPASVSGRANLDIWVRTFARVDMTRLTFDPARDGLPVWSPDGTRLAFSSARATQAWRKSM